jgi:RNA polymerase sigma factor (sigma-70 family)
MKTKAVNSEVSFQNLHQDIIDDCKKGDQRAQFQIYKLYYKAMYNTSLRIVQDTMEAEDIMQEAFLSAFEKIGTYSGTVSFGAWLRKIVENRSIDYLRKKNGLVFEDITSCQAIEDKSSNSVSFDEVPELRINKIMEILKLLPEGCRKIFSLYHFEGFDHEEIGEILAISSSSSRSQYSRARSRIKSEFRKSIKQVI